MSGPPQGSGPADEGWHPSPWVDRVIALALLTLVAPLLVAIALLVWVFDGRPILYRGERLGLGMRPFRMYKFRTLAPDAQQRIGTRLMTPKLGMLTRTGNFLRETRLDELPQLYNVLRGHMRLVGPRPERREVYEAKCRDIPGYERRFRVHPGLIGVSQVFTPHGTPKALRARMDGRALLGPRSAWRDVGLLVFTGWCVVRQIARRVLRFLRRTVLEKGLLRRYQEKRKLSRRSPRLAYLVRQFQPDAADPFARLRKVEGIPLVDANEDCILVDAHGAEPWREGEVCDLVVALQVGREARRVRRARCRVRRSALRLHDGRPRTVLAYEPVEDRDRYVIEQYLLRNSVASSRPGKG